MASFYRAGFSQARPAPHQRGFPMSKQKADLRLVHARKPPAAKEIAEEAQKFAQMEFRALKLFRNMSQDERLRQSHGFVENIRPMVVAAGEIVVMTKADLITKVEAGHNVIGEMLLDLANTKEDAKAILDVISAAEARLVVALANVEGEALAEEANV
jgi:hypothetical protein